MTDGTSTDALLHPLADLDNRLLRRLSAGDATLGLFLVTADSMIAEAVGTFPIDWVVIDMEAAPASRRDALHCLQALSGSPVTPLLRVSGLSRPEIEHALDVGARGVIIPKVNTPEEARAAADAALFPPLGRRGLNPVRASAYFSNIESYFRDCNANTLCIVQLETAEAIDNADQIAEVDGVDGVFIGMGDLAMSYGQPGKMDGERMDEARRCVLEAATRHGKYPGLFAYSEPLAHSYLQEGFQLIAFGNEIKILREGVVGATGRLRCAE